ncbi:MAG TPA: lysine-sensitive aspartokinase 3 [Bryobacteraceae bacterium]|nr:lysine-sensitive aspartokinase 3 [Bryobacteraceae bacterium]HOQ47026.1 lysine-sensitive aspartokinase 3 [Bryobacteraceae bacterium]HPQ16144.1 lysine-sensitive aspartokinase 3 [Bryobacteraceae bacterium]HPU71101.1 lysine-sensitive aspartokinase 3 [Bryobacteraceae bacterium]
MIVMKFGGSSVESAAAIQRVASIVKSRLERQPVVVVSAMGKTTNKLLALATDAVEGRRGRALEQLGELRDYHLSEARQLVSGEEWAALETSITDHIQELGELITGLSVLGELTPRFVDAISSYGERLSSRIVTAAFRSSGMDAVHADSRRLIVTDNRHTQANPIYPETYARLCDQVAPLAREGKVVVMGGFIAATANGVTTTLGRGGSDFTAAIVGAGIGAEEIQIWTDVDGMMTADPRSVPEARRLKLISFAEAAELAYFGAKVLHPATVLPAVEKNIPIVILNSRRPEVSGTRIVKDAVPCANPIKSIACKRHITVVNIHSTRMLMAYGFLARIFEVFNRYETAVDMLSTSEVSVSATIDNTKNLEKIQAELEQFSEVRVERDRAIICLVGDNIRCTPGIAARIFGALSPVNVLMVSQGGSQWNLSLVVDDTDLLKAVQLLHREFFQELDPAVFE